MYVTVEDIKRQINVQWDEDDSLIESMIEAAELSIEKTIGTPDAGAVSMSYFFKGLAQ